MRVLLTGGAGFIGTHTAVELVAAGHEPVCFDNLSNSQAGVMSRVEQICGSRVPLIVADIRDKDAVRQVLRDHAIEAVIHFAGLKAVGEAVEKPLLYYDNNVAGSVILAEAMKAEGVKTLIFSSSATVYGSPQYLPLDEDHPTAPTNPYGHSKLMVEQIFADLAHAEQDWSIGILRYFNPVGAHKSGLIGEDPSGIPNNLMPYISRVASGRLEQLSVYGDDYATEDGTGVRDYIHVSDLAEGHVAALDRLASAENVYSVWNLGTGSGHSVLEVIEAFERTNGIAIPHRIVDRRAGDVASSFASPDRALAELGWKARFDLEEMCRSAWQFESGAKSE